MRIFYCPKHGRVTESTWEFDCEHCYRWYFRLSKFKAKRTGES